MISEEEALSESPDPSLRAFEIPEEIQEGVSSGTLHSDRHSTMAKEEDPVLRYILTGGFGSPEDLLITVYERYPLEVSRVILELDIRRGER